MMNTVQYMPSFDAGADALSMGQALQSKIVLGPARASQVPAQLGPTNTAGLVNRPLYLHQPQTVQPATSTTARLAVGTQLINAYNADGQPVTIAINPNGTHQVLTGVSAAPAGNSLTLGTTNGISLQAQPTTVQVQPMRSMQAGTTATLINTPQGQRLVQLSNADLQAAGAAPQGITYKLVQQAMPAPNGARILVQQAAPNAGPTMVQRMVQQPTSTAPMAMKAPTLQHVALRQAAPAATNTNLVGPTAQQLGGMQMGRSLIQVASRPNTVTTYNPATGLRTSNNTAQLADVQQGSAASLQLPSTMLVRPGGGVEGTVAAGVTAQQLQAMTAQLQQNAGGVGVAAGAQQGGMQVSLQPAQSLQQQVKDTVAQQRQQQLLASLRARVASLNPAQPGSNSASGTSPTMAAQVNSGFPQVMLKQSALGAAQQQQQQQQQLLGLRTGSDGNTNSAQAGLLQSLLNSQAVRQQQQQQQQRMLEESQQLNLLSLTRAQQQALLGGADLGGFRSETGDVGQANGAHGVFHLPGQVSLSEELLSQNLALKQQFRLSDGMDAGKANGAALSMAASSLSASAGARSNGVSSPSPLLGMNPTADGLHLDNGGGGTHVNMLGNNALLPPGLGAIDLHGASKHELNANNLQQQAGKDDLKSILMSIGLELARHGIPVSTAVEAGWLGVLSQGDVAVLQATYAQEERRLANINNAAASLAHQQQLQQQAAAAVQLPPLPDVPPGLMGWPHLSALNRFAESSHAAAGGGLAANHGLGGASSRPSNGSPAASVHSAYGSAGSHRDASFGPAGLGMPGPTANEPAAAAVGPAGTLQEIDDARFSAFAYDFFGGMEAGEGPLGGSVGGELLEPLEPASQRSSSAEVAPLRAPSWPADGPSVHTLKTGTQSVASFSELGHSTSAEHPSSATKDNCDAASTASSSNHELVARIANLDLGCGFY